MAKAILMYVDENNNNITLESGSLFYIDQNTKVYENIKTLRNAYFFKIKEKKGKIKLFYISSTSRKDELPILINDKKMICLKDDPFGEQISEIEKGRKLLFNSKNKLFLKLALSYKAVKDTFNYSVQLSKDQYDFAIKNGLKVEVNNGTYFIQARELFGFVLSNNKIKLLRKPFENSLDTWKSTINNMTFEELYFYSRNISILISKYNDRIKRRVGIKNFEPRSDNLKLLGNNDVALSDIKKIIKVRRKVKE